MIYLNDFAPHDGVLRVHLIAHGPDYPKSDAFLLELDGEYLLIDGGMEHITASYTYLVRLRARLADRAPAEAAHAPLRLSWFVSHFHIDHVSTTIEYTLRDQRFAFTDVYLPPRSALDPKYNCNGDRKYRDPCLVELARFQPACTLHNIAFGEKGLRTLPFAGAELTIYPPDHDWGVGERLNFVAEHYSRGDWTHHSLAVAAINACCMWLGVRYAGRQCLFTGDTMKREADRHDEPFDAMRALWGERIGRVDLLKYLHHGYVRDSAAAGMLAMKPAFVVVTHPESTTPAAMRAIGGRMPEVINCALRDYVVEIAADGGIKVI